MTGNRVFRFRTRRLVEYVALRGITISGNDDPVIEDYGSSELVHSVQVDSFGRRWVVEAVNFSLLDSLSTEYDLSRFVLPDDGDESTAGFVPAGGTQYIRPLASTFEVIGGHRDGDLLFDGTPSAPYAPTARQDKTVLLYKRPQPIGNSYEPGNANCTGVLVADNWVLTAAHCVTVNATGAQMHVGRFAVCTRGNSMAGAECTNALMFRTHDKWEGTDNADETTDYRWDIALVKIQAPLGSTWGTMPLSRASGRQIRSRTAYVSGYPHSLLQLTGGINEEPATMTSFNAWTVAHGREGSWDSGATIDTKRSFAYSHINAGGGNSGGPMYFYTGGAPTHPHEVFAIASYLTMPLKCPTNEPGCDLEESGILDPDGDVNDAYLAGSRIKPKRKWILGHIQ